MSLSHYTGIGRVQSCELRTVNGLEICTIKVPVNTWKPGRDGGEGTETTIWCELTAFYDPNRDGGRFNKAQAWAERYKTGDIVSIQGTPVVRTFKRQNDEPAASIRLEDPVISKVMGQSREAELVGAGAGSAAADEPPF